MSVSRGSGLAKHTPCMCRSGNGGKVPASRLGPRPDPSRDLTTRPDLGVQSRRVAAHSLVLADADAGVGPVGLGVWAAQPRFHAARLYSWTSPPRRSRRSTPAVGGRTTRSFRAIGSGGAWFSERCGLWPL